MFRGMMLIVFVCVIPATCEAVMVCCNVVSRGGVTYTSAPCKSLSPDQQKTELIVLMMPFQDLDSKKTDADYRFYVEKIVNVVNCYIDTHRPQQWDDESSPWILRECEPLMYDPVTAKLYSCICDAVTAGGKMSLDETLISVSEQLKIVKNEAAKKEREKCNKRRTEPSVALLKLMPHGRGKNKNSVEKKLIFRPSVSLRKCS